MPLVFLVRKKHLPVIYHPAYHSPASFSHTLWHRHRKRWASVTEAGPAIIQHWFNAKCFMCLSIIGLEHCWVSFNARQWWDSDGSLYMYTPNQVPAYIAYRPSIQNNIHEAFSQC